MKLVRQRHGNAWITVSLLLPLLSACAFGGTAEPSPAPQAAAENAGDTSAFEGRMVTAITFEPEHQPLDGLEIQQILPLHRGEPFRVSAVRDSIERLFASGRYHDIQVDASPSQNGVAVRFITAPRWFIGHVSVEFSGGEPPNQGQLVNASHLELGDPFEEDALTASEESIRGLLVANGYFDAEVEHSLLYDDLYQQVRINFIVTATKRAVYTAPQITGDTSVLSAAKITRATHWARFLLPGFRGVMQSRTRAGIDNIRFRYENDDRLLATVVLDGIAPSADGRTATAKISVDPGPVVNITAEGAKVSHKRLVQSVPIFEEHTIDPDLLNEGAANLRDYFQSQGYFEADVQFKRQDQVDNHTEIVYTIDPGDRHRLVHVGISGNHYFDARTIRERLLVAPVSFEFRRGRYAESMRRRDEEAIADLYRSNGFRDVLVASRVEDDYNGKGGDIAIFYTIVEGPQYRVSSLDIEGPVRVDLDKVLDQLSSQRGQVFSELNVAEDRASILEVYGDQGFADATFEWDSKPGAQPNTVDLRFTIHEGEQQFVRQVVATGLATTRPRLVNRQLLLNPGDPLSPSAMAETQRRLYDLGIFAQVNMAVQNADGEESRRYVLYDLEEARRYSVTGGVGAEFARIGGNTSSTDLSNPGGAAGFSPRVSLTVSRLNFLGAGQTLSFQSRLSTLQKRAAIDYFVPRIFNKPKLDATFTVLYDNTDDVRTFQSKRGEASAQLAQRLSKSITMFYRFNWRKVDISNLKIDLLLVPRLAQNVRVGIASYNFVQDRRDDPIDPHKGVYNTVDVGLATTAFGSSTNFGRVLARNATYYKLGPKIVLARQTQFGFEPAFHIPAGSDPNDAIPLPERFYGGGSNTLRAFPENQAGPRDTSTGFPLGGSALLYNNTELRFPVYGSNVNAVLFHDAGNVYSNVGNMSFRATQRSDSDFDYMVHAVGVGVRYRTPVGPLRLDLAYSINPPAYVGFRGNYTQFVQCTATNSCGTPAGLQISHFQFFFSIGQAF